MFTSGNRLLFRQEVPGSAELDSILREASAAPANLGVRLSFCESVVWDAENLEQRRVTVHFVKHNELLQEPEGSLILIEGKQIKLQLIFWMKCFSDML